MTGDLYTEKDQAILMVGVPSAYIEIPEGFYPTPKFRMVKRKVNLPLISEGKKTSLSMTHTAMFLQQVYQSQECNEIWLDVPLGADN